MQPRRFYLDTQSRSLVSGVDSTLPAAVPSFFQEDVESIELYFLRPNPDQAPPYLVEDYSANTVKLAVGLTAPAALQTSWSAVATAITASITTLTNGSAGANEVQKLSFAGNPPSEGGYSLTLPSRSVTVSSVAAGVFTAVDHGLLNGQSVTLTGFTITAASFANSTYLVVQRTKDTFGIATTAGGTAINAQVTSGGGTATLPAITTPQIDRLADAAGVSQALVDAGLVVSGQPQIIVTGSYAQGFTFTFANSQANINFDAMTVSSTLAAAKGLQANVSFNTTDINDLIAAGATSGLFFEVEVTDGTKRHTYQSSCNLGDDIIASASPAPVPVGSTSFTLLAPDNSQWVVSIDNDGILTATKQ